MAKKKGKGILSKIFSTNQRTLGKWQIVIGILALFPSFTLSFYYTKGVGFEQFSFYPKSFIFFALYALITGYYNLKVGKK